jgi:hypothetical protein
MSEDDKPVDEILHESRVKLRREVATQAENQRRVIVVAINISFWNIVKLTFKCMFAGIIVFTIPTFIMVNLILDATIR